MRSSLSILSVHARNYVREPRRQCRDTSRRRGGDSTVRRLPSALAENSTAVFYTHAVSVCV